MRKTACTFCNRLKIRCDEVDHPSGCLSCRKRNLRCEYTPKLIQGPSSDGLPDRSSTISLLRAYFTPHGIQHLEQTKFIGALESGNAPRAIVFAILAIVIRGVVPADKSSLAAKTLRDRSMAELVNNTDAILYAQTLAIVSGSLYDDPSCMFTYPLQVATALRALLSWNIHRLDDTSFRHIPQVRRLNEGQREIVRRLFWRLYALDRMHAMFGDAFTVHDADLRIRYFTDDAPTRLGPLFDADLVHDNDLWEFGPKMSKTYFYHCFMRMTTLMGKVRRLVDSVKMVKNMDGERREMYMDKVTKAHLGLVELLNTWYMTLPLLYSDLTQSVPDGAYYAVEWVIPLHFMYYGCLVDMQLLHSPHPVDFSDHLPLLEQVMGVVKFAMERSTQAQFHISLRTTHLTSECYKTLLELYGDDPRAGQWKENQERCRLFFTEYGKECSLLAQRMLNKP